MNNSLANRRSPLGAVFPGQPIPRLYDRAVDCCALGKAESCVQRARRDYPDLPVVLRLGGEFLETQHQSIRRSSAKTRISTMMERISATHLDQVDTH